MLKYPQTRKALYLAIAAASQLILTNQVLAGPEGGQVVGGRGSIDHSGLTTTVQQQTDRMAIDWESFNVAADERVQFIQPSSSSLALNRVLSHTASEIHGRIEANGHILLVNPNGVFFGENSHINVGGMIASGLSIDPADFMNGEFTLTSLEGSEGKVINSGIINAATGGPVSLIGQQVKNEGMISARLGAVNLAAGKEAVVTFDQQGLVGVRITKEILQDELGVDAAVINSGEITAEGGRILLSASTSQDIFSQAVNHGELNSASSVVVHEDGSFTLGAGADVINTGSLDVSSNLGSAGHVVIIGENITHSGQIRANTGAGQAGSIELHSGDTTRLTESASVVAEAANAGAGGDIKILGDKVGLFDEAQLSASGAHGGGDVLIGGDESGINTLIRNADFIYLGKDTQISADAVLDGDGGKIITFASDTARIHGELTARGGEFGGNGGFIETSGLKGFELSSTPRISSPMANGGIWLIDPYDITISNDELNNIPNVDNVFESSEDDSVIHYETLETVFNDAGNESIIIIRTGSESEGYGNIRLDDSIQYNISNGNTATLRLEAHNNIIFGNSRYISSASGNSGKLNLELIANLDGDTSNGGNIIFNQGSYVSTSGGYFTAENGNHFLTHVSSTPSFVSIDTSTGNDEIGGAITINMSGDVILGSRVKTGGANFSVLSANRFTNSYTGNIAAYTEADFDDLDLQRGVIDIDGSFYNSEPGDPNFNTVYSLIDTSHRTGGGDISITSQGDIRLGSVNFKYYDTDEESDVVRVGSITAISESGSIYLSQMLNFNNSGERNADGDIHNNIPPNPSNPETTFIDLKAAEDIHINAQIADMRWGDGRDSLNIDLDAGSNINVGADIYTAGGNFTSFSKNFNSASFLINTNRANASLADAGVPRGNANFSHGGDVTINASSSILLGNVTTDGDCSVGVCSGDLELKGLNTALDPEEFIPDTVSVSQAVGSSIKVAGKLIVDAGVNLDESTVNLAEAGNKFIGNIEIISAGNVTLRDSEEVSFDASSISGNLDVTSSGAITQTGALSVTGTTTLSAGDDNAVTLGNEGNVFSELVTISSANNVTLVSAGNLAVADINVSGNGNRSSGSISLTSLNGGLTTGELRATGGNQDDDKTNRRGGDISLTASGDIYAGDIFVYGGDGINSIGARSGGDGGDVLVTSNTGSITLASVNSSGGNANTNGFWNRHGGNAGAIEINSLTVGQNTNLTKDLVAQGGQSEGSDVTGNGGDITINGDALLASNIILNTSYIGGPNGNPTRGDITFNGQVDSHSSALTPFNLSLVANSVTFNGNVGTSARLGNVVIDATGNVDASIFQINARSLDASLNNSIDFTAAGINTSGAQGEDGGDVLINARTVSVEEINSKAGLAQSDSDGLNGGRIIVNGQTVTLGVLTSDGSSPDGAGVNSGTGGEIVITAMNSGDSPSITLTGDVSSLHGGDGNIRFILSDSGSVHLNHDAFFTSKLNVIGSTGQDTLTGLNTASTWVVDGVKSGRIGNGSDIDDNVTFSDIETLQGADAVDVFNISALFDGTVNGGAGSDEFNFLAGGGASVVDGGTGDNDTVTGRDTTNLWAIGDSGISLSDAASSSLYITSINNIDRLQGGSDTDTFNINNNFTGTLAGGDGDDTFEFFANGIVSAIEGGNGLDMLKGKDIATTWTHSLAIQSLVATNSEQTYVSAFNGIDALQGGADVDIFNISSPFIGDILGGYADDVFTLTADVQGNINGEGGNDTFTIGSTIDALLDGGEGDENTLVGNTVNNEWVIAGENSGSVSDISNSTPAVYANFQNMQLLVGSSAVDKFILEGGGYVSEIRGGDNDDSLSADNFANTWTLVNASSGSLNSNDYSITFNGIENLTGNLLTDNFIFTSDIPYNGVIDAVGIDNTVTLQTVADVLIDLASQAINGVQNADVLIGNGSGSVTVLGDAGDTRYWELSNLENAFDADGNDDGEVSDGTNTIRFINVANLNGSDANDVFTLPGGSRITGLIDGGSGTNSIINDVANANWILTDVQQGNLVRASDTVASFENIDVLTGSGSDSLTGFNQDSNWQIYGTNSGSLQLRDGTGDLLSFSGIQNITGGDAIDDFTVTNAGILTGILNGGGGTEDILRARNTTNDWTITGENQGNVSDRDSVTPEVYANFVNLEYLVGGTGNDYFAFDEGASIVDANGGIGTDAITFEDVTELVNVTLGQAALNGVRGIERFIGNGENSTLTANNTTGINIWTIYNFDLSDTNVNGENDGEVTLADGSGTIQFINFANLQGGSGNDSFRFDVANSGVITGSINGGTGTNELIGRDIDNTWTLGATGSLRETESSALYAESFTNINVLRGGNALDVFNIEADFNGSIYGDAGNDAFNINAVVTALFGESGNDQFIFTSPVNAGRAVNIDGGSGQNTLNGRHANTTWRVAGTVNRLSVTGGAAYVDNFSNIQVLQGGGFVDTFVIDENYAGIIRGGAANDMFTINAATITLFGDDGDDIFDFTSANNAGSALAIDGGNGQNMLRGRHVANSWNLNALGNNLSVNGGTIYVADYVNIQQLDGGDSVDIFTIDADYNGIINGNDGNDVFNINAIVDELSGDNDDDRFVFSSLDNLGRVETIYGGAGTDTIIGRNQATEWLLNNAGNTLRSENGIYVNGMNSIEVLQGGTAIDTFTIDSNFIGSILGGNNNDIFHINATVDSLFGEAGNDQFIFSSANNAGSAATIDGGSGNDILVGRNTANTWLIDNAGSRLRVTGSGSDYVQSFTDMQVLQGGNTVDTYDLDADFDGDVFAGAGNDIFNINASVNLLSGEDGDDNFLFDSLNNNGIATSILGGDGENTLVGRNSASTWNIAASGHSVGVTNGAIYVASFEDIQILQGGNAIDDFSIDIAFGGTISGGDGDDLFTINAVANTLRGQDGNDQFVFSAISNAGSAELIVGGDGDDTLVGRNVTNNWNLAATGNSLADAANAAYVIAFEDVDILQGGSAVDNFLIDAAFDGEIRGGSGDDLFSINGVVSALLGEAGNDQFLFSSLGNDGSTNSIDGGDGEDRLIARNVDNTWNLSNGNNLGVSDDDTYVASFSNIQILQGGNATDRFFINAAFSGSIYGGEGNDIFTVNAAVNSLVGEDGDDEFSFISAANAGSAVSLDGGAGTNLLKGRNQDSIWTLTGHYSGSLAEDLNTTNYVTLFSNIHNLEGGAAEDTLVGQNQSNQWQIDNIDAGRLGSPGTDVTTHLVFSSMQNIVGGTSQDNFIFTTSASDITGLVDGGISGNNTVEDTLDLSLLGQAVIVELFDSNTDNLHAINMEEIIAPVTTAENNYLYGASDRAYIWTIDGINSGSVARADSPSLDSTTRFHHFGQLRGGENNDRFEVVSGGSIAGTIHGGDGDGIDFADYSHTNAHVTVSLGGDGSLGVTGIDGIEGVVGNNGGSSSAQFNSVIGITSGNNIWTIGSFDSVTDGINDGQIAITLGDGSTKTISFENFNVLSGGSGDDEFNFSRDGNNDGVLLGYINGGTGNNIFNAAISSNNPIASAADQTIQIRNVPQDLTNLDAFTPLHGVTQVFGFTDIIANANTNSTLVSADGANTWDINANGTNRLATSVADIAFSGFSRLTGGSALDNFYVRSLEGPLRVIDGGSDSSIDTIDFSQLDANTAVVVGLGETALADMNILGIERVNAHNHANNELVSDAGTNSWRITDVDTGSLNTNLMFSGFANLTGTTGNDSFIFVNENASLSGVMDGGAGAGFDTLDLTGVNRDISLRLTGSATADDELRAINLEQIEASNNFVNTLLSGSTDNFWSISGNNTGSLANASGVIEFIGFRNLVGNTGNDQFVFYEQGSLDGYIDGSTQPTPGEDRLDLSRLGSVDVLLAESGLGYRGIERIIGNDQDSTLRGQGANTWNLIGQNSGNINNTIIFEGFTALIGGEGNDQFNLTQGNLAGSVSGGLGNDAFVLGDAAIAGGIYGDGGNDVLEATVTAGTTGAVNFVGGTGNNRLTATGGGAGFTAQHAFTSTQNGQLRYLDNANNAYTISYSDVTDILDNIIATSLTINTTSEADTITLRNRAYTFNDLTSVAYNNKNNLVIAASAGDQVVVNGTVNIPQLLTIQDAQVSAAAGGSIVAAGLRLDGTAAVGSENNRLNVDINELYIRSTHGDVYLTEHNTLNISEFSANGLIDLVLDGDLTSSIALASAQGFNAASTNGNVILDKENALSGTLNLSAANDINLRNLTATNLADISARQLNINSNGVINGSGFIDVNGLTSLVSGGNINLANREHNFNSVQIGSAAGVSIDNMDLLTLIGVDASGTVNINAQGINANGGIAANDLSLNGNQGAVSLSSNIRANGEANIAGQSLSVAGDITASAIQLHAQADALLNGELNTLNGQTISLTANNLMQNGLITAGTDVRITTTEDLTQNADILANNRIVLSAGTDLLMNGSYATQGNMVEVLAGDTLNMNRINAENGIRVTGGIITQQHDLLSSNGDIDITASSITMNSGTALTANTGSIQINTDTDITARSLNAGRDIFLSALGNVQLNDDLIANTGAIDIQGRNINLAGDLMGQTDINIVSAAGSLQQQGLVQSQQGNIAIDVEGDLVMAGNSEARASGDIVYRAADLAITRMETEAGAVTLAAHDGAVTDNNGQTINVTAQRLVVDAEAGIGANDVIETLVNELSVSNNQGDIRLENGQEVRVDRLRSNGNIVFSNLAGSVTLDNTNGLLFTRNEPDARLAGGTMNANYDIGTLTINVAQGDLTAVNSPNLDNPDIVARNAALIAPTGNIGSPGRPLVIYVKDSLFIGGLRSWSPLWGFDTAPQFVENTSTIQGNLSDLLASGSEQLVAVETLEEVNPAIFTSVRNYFYDDISILLPRDQLYYDGEYEQ